MNLSSIILIAIALSIDACVVSFAHGLILEKNRLKNLLQLAVVTAVFQAVMPIIGYFVTRPFYKYLEPVGKWIIFAIFMYLGIKIIKESFEEDRDIPCCLSFQCLIFIGIATSIDALAAGITFAITSTDIFKAAVIIGITTFIFSAVGFLGGYCLKKLPTRFLEIFAGILLIFLSVKSLF